MLWLACALLHGLYDHVVFGRGAGLLVVVLPMLVMMAIGVFGVLRQRETSPRSRSRLALFDAPSVGSVREVMSGHGGICAQQGIKF